MNIEEQIVYQLYRGNGVKSEACVQTLRSYRKYKERKAVRKFACDLLEEILGDCDEILRAYYCWQRKNQHINTVGFIMSKLIFDTLKSEGICMERYIHKRYGYLNEELPYY